jgi:predicted lipoprotein with Yx(FWY)xxD motif
MPRLASVAPAHGGQGEASEQRRKYMTTSHDTRKIRHRRRWTLLLVPAAAAGLAAVAACGSSGTSASSSGGSTPSASTSAAAAASGLKTAKVGGVTVLTNAKGFTLYSFAPDTATKSACNGACATSWPPVMAPVNASAVRAPFATITRSGGSTQLTFRGHPLYTFVGDTSPGQAKGNGVNEFGGLWHEAPASSTAPASTSPSGGGGYGY